MPTVRHDEVREELLAGLSEAGRREYETLGAVYGARQLTAQLAELRSEANLSQRQAAKRAGVDQADVSRIESGQITPSLPTLLRLLDAVGATLVLARTTPSRPSTKRPPAAAAARKRGATADPAPRARPTAGPARTGSIAQASLARAATAPAVPPKTRRRGTDSSSDGEGPSPRVELSDPFSGDRSARHF